MGLRFEWDPRKAAVNVKKHDASFEEASSGFSDTLSLTIPDADHSRGEACFLDLGVSLGVFSLFRLWSALGRFASSAPVRAPGKRRGNMKK